MTDWRDTVRNNPIPRELVHAEMDRIEAAEGHQLLADVATMVSRYVSAGPEQIDTLALWIVHTHALPAFYTTGRLYITSPEANCGKSVTLSVIGALVANPMMTVNISPAAMYRSMEEHTPTFLIDEIDKSITAKGAKDSESTSMLLSVLNSGYRRGITVPRCVGPKNTVKNFPTFAPVALAGILAGVDQPFMSRSIPIMLQRADADSDLEELELDFEVVAEFEALRDRIAAWAAVSLAEIEISKPERPDGLKGRNAEIWMPLMRVAAVGGWLDRAHEACEAITLFEVPGAETPAWEMLRDTQLCFHDEEEFVATNVLIDRLERLEDADWSNWSRGRGLSVKNVAKLLGQYGVRPVVRRHEGEQRRGYECDGKLGDAWILYVDPVENSRKAAETAIKPLSLFSNSLSPSLSSTTTPVAVTRDTRDDSRDATDTSRDARDAFRDASQNGNGQHSPVTADALRVTEEAFPDVEPF